MVVNAKFLKGIDELDVLPHGVGGITGMIPPQFCPW
jgi:hypothetical protein